MGTPALAGSSINHLSENALTTMKLSKTALLGRQDGKRQALLSNIDCMIFQEDFESSEHWQSYLTGFYRAAGYSGSGNRTIRKHL